MATTAGRSAAQRGVLIAMVLALGTLTIDGTIVRVALPAIQRDLDISDVAQQWVVNAYLLTLGIFVVAGGRLGDLLGRRRVFLAGLALFTVASVVSGLSPSGGVLLTARAIQGVGAAVMMPGCTAIVTDAFAGEHLGRAMGIMAGTAAAGLSIGPLLGGLLIEVLSWRWIFFVNVPIAIVAALLTLRSVPESRRPDAPPIDVHGLATLGVGLGALTLGVMQAQVWGWSSAATLSLIAAGVIGLVAFVAVELRAPLPLVDVRMLRDRTFAAANAIGFFAQFVITGLVVLLALYLQNVLGHTALTAGVMLLPLTLPVLVSSPVAGRLADRIAVRTIVGTGMTLLAIGTFAIGAAARSGSYWPMLPALVIVGSGFSAVLTSMTTAIMAAAPSDDRGMVSGIYTTARDIGASLGVAIMGTLLATLESLQLDADGAARIEDSRVHAVLAGAPGATRDPAAVRVAADVFEHAFATTLQITALAAAIGAVLAWTLLARTRPATAPRA